VTASPICNRPFFSKIHSPRHVATMGAEFSAPRPGTELLVIGGGLPRTGTASFSAALEILLGGPVHHGGTQVIRGPPANICGWIRLLTHWPPKTDGDRAVVTAELRAHLDGYAAAVDTPMPQLVPELMELYPDAKVICTTRDPAAWEKSIAMLASAASVKLLNVILLPLPTMRHWLRFNDGLRAMWGHRYEERQPFTTKTYHDHIAWIKEIVPADRLVFFDCRDGWEPLCKALRKEVPNVPFPRINDSEAIDRIVKEIVMKGLLRWAGLLAGVGVVMSAYYLQWK
jgi:hypothetical protein